ncbi:MAG TPA: Crp/Fnr family transcriptional regulator [Deltaproteobacteria bacterium]|nr:Crp/Fnr family transcriptional regulator [Deltaproteobacteria bacterium]HQI82127.1 Crp/Fnr family transcriptional regulator [Deltaproteobacteria bacterium]
MDTRKRLQDIPLFQGLSERVLEALSRRVLIGTYQPGETILAETDPVRSFFVVLSGQVKLSKSSAEGREQTLYLLGPGEPFGLCTAFATSDFPAEVVALRKSDVLAIPGSAVDEIVMQEPGLLLNILRVLSRRLRESMSLVESLALKDIPQRVAAFIVALERTGEEDDTIELPVTHRELSKIVGSTPEALSRALRKLQDDGVLEVQGRSIAIFDRDALQALAQGE